MSLLISTNLPMLAKACIPLSPKRESNVAKSKPHFSVESILKPEVSLFKLSLKSIRKIQRVYCNCNCNRLFFNVKITFKVVSESDFCLGTRALQATEKCENTFYNLCFQFTWFSFLCYLICHNLCYNSLKIYSKKQEPRRGRGLGERL